MKLSLFIAHPNTTDREAAEAQAFSTARAAAEFAMKTAEESGEGFPTDVNEEVVFTTDDAEKRLDSHQSLYFTDIDGNDWVIACTAVNDTN